MHDPEPLACVPFVPWRCPSCGDGKPRTYGQRGRVRYHQCQLCLLRFRSLERFPKSVAELMTSPNMPAPAPQSDFLCLDDLAREFGAPPAVVLAVASSGDLAKAGFPAMQTLKARSLWPRAAAQRFLDDPAKRRAARTLCTRAMVGREFRLLPEDHREDLRSGTSPVQP